MNIREISDVFKDTAADITAIKSYNFGWASDRVRQGNTEDFQELNEFPRVFFAVPTITGSDQTRKQDTYQVTLFFDDLLGYDNEGDEDPTLQIDKWANLQQYANYFVQRLNKIKQSILPNYLFIPEAPSITFDSFTGLQRMITVQLSFNLVVPTNCDPSIITLVQCIANIVTSSNLTASLTTVLKFAASLEGRATVTADINFVQKAQASLLTSANVTGNLTIPKTFNASLLATGTTTADLTVNAAASLLLDLYPDAAAAYSLRKLKTAYTGSAVRVRASTSGAEGDVSFDVNSTISASSTVTVTAVGTSGLSIGQQVTFTTFWNAGGSNQNVFVTTWYDQSGNANNATQTTQANQPQIVVSGTVLTQSGKPIMKFTANSQVLNTNAFALSANRTYVMTLYNLTNVTSSYKVYLGAQAGGVDAFVNGIVGQFGASSIAQSFIGSGLSSNVVGVNAMAGNAYFLLGAYIQGSSQHQHYRNGALNAQNTSLAISPTTNTQVNSIMFSTTNGNDLRTNEAIIWNSYQSTNRVGIETNINTYYAIY
jgi:hypothetical protein